MNFKSGISENSPRYLRCAHNIRAGVVACCLWLLLSQPVVARDQLTVAITQFPSTLNPNIDTMAAKSYVLGAVLRPFTVYDASWKLACLLCVNVPSIEKGDAVPV